MADFRTVPADQKKEVGVKINELKNAALDKINGLKEQMEEAEASSGRNGRYKTTRKCHFERYCL